VVLPVHYARVIVGECVGFKLSIGLMLSENEVDRLEVVVEFN
jgi:hypothetical protein